MNDSRILAELGLWPRWTLRRDGHAPAGVEAPTEASPALQKDVPTSLAADAPSAHARVSAQAAAGLADSIDDERATVSAVAARGSVSTSAPVVPRMAPGAPVRLDSVADAASIRTRTIEQLDFDALAAHASACVACGLCETRTNVVFGVGDPNADWLFVGEGPGANEDLQGEPFVGQAGKLLDNMLRALGMERRRHVYIANVVKCRPPGNRDPLPEEIAACEPYLQRQIALIQPKVIVALGRFAAQTLLRSDAKIGSLRQQAHDYQGVPVVVTYHPAYLLRTLQDKAKAWADLQFARDLHRRATAERAASDA
ncbi:uracil-DNA glycosylase [Chitinasiproducens palmae]|uniref:Type-4 uracil-DNA glycosylase n=1 Tax=Chitinasiproducens palmae TaxID=1770053 RepID=A0A1H2PM50_9BURK|nr:DNA polymerase [Chitinasiproducens palmae]